jgi:hypothetical protein
VQQLATMPKDSLQKPQTRLTIQRKLASLLSRPLVIQLEADKIVRDLDNVSMCLLQVNVKTR